MNKHIRRLLCLTAFVAVVGVQAASCRDVEPPIVEPTQWRNFGDPMLDSLIEVGLLRNYDVAMATRRIAIARNAVASARGGYFPVVSTDVGYTYGRESGRMAGAIGQAVKSSYYHGSVNISWEVDLFGRINAAVKSKKASLRVSRAERAGIKVSLEAEIASAYVRLRVKQAQYQVAERHAASQLKVLKIAEARHEAGLASMLDVDQARTVYYSTVANIPMLENAIHCDINAIAVLLGEVPDSLYSALSVPAPIPGYVQPVASGVPADLLRRRPDVMQAEEQIGVCAADLGIARKDYLPTLTINGSVGTAAHRAGDLFDGPAFTYSVTPTLSWTVFDGLQRRYNVASARESLKAAVDNYNLVVLTAFEEADNALSTYLADLHYIERLDRLVEAAADYDKRSIEQYKSGLTAFINVANAQLSYLSYRNTQIEARGQALAALIDLYRALGGGPIDN